MQYLICENGTFLVSEKIIKFIIEKKIFDMFFNLVNESN